MRPTVLLHLTIAGLLTGCAVEGVVVEKNSRPFPFIDSVGMDGMYKFKLRDAQGHISSQMVTPEVFVQYNVGDYFSDLQPAKRSPVQLEEVRTVKTVQDAGHHARKRSSVAQAHPGKKIAHARHGKKVVHVRNAKKHSSKAQAHRTKKHPAKTQAHRKAGSRARPS